MIKQPFDPGNLKIKRQKILNLFMDRNWHDANELVDKFGSAWNQRKNLDLKLKGGISFISRFIPGTRSLWAYRLITPNRDIDLEHTCLKSKVPKPKLPLVNNTALNPYRSKSCRQHRRKPFYQLSLF